MSEAARETLAAVEQSLARAGWKGHRVRPVGAVIAGPPVPPTAEHLDRLMAAWRFDDPFEP